MKINSAWTAKFYGVVFIGTLFLLFPALYNGYPILNPDDGTYLISGFKVEVPGDRPITYGLLLRAFSLNGVSLFLAAFSQCWLMSWLLVKNIQLILRNATQLFPASIFTIFFLSFFTSLSWISSELIPDVETSLAFLSLFPLLLQRESRLNTILLAGIYTVCVATHMSNLMIFLFLLTGIWCIRKMFFPDVVLRKKLTRMILISVVLTLSTLIIVSRSSRQSKHVFFIGAMLEQGLLKPYLDDHCPVEHYNICRYKDSLPANANDFFWKANSPLYQANGGWAESKDEYNKIVCGSLKEPKYIWLHAKMSLIFTARQFKEFNIGDGNIPFKPGHMLNDVIKKRVPRDVYLLNNARQQKDDFISSLALPNKIIYVVVLLSLAVTVLLFFLNQKMYQPYKLFVITGTMMIVLNIWNCATFAQINGRYGCRVMWLIPMFAVIGLINYVQNLKSKA